MDLITYVRVRCLSCYQGVKIYQEMIGAEEDATKKSCVQTDLVDILVQEKSMSSEHAHLVSL